MQCPLLGTSARAVIIIINPETFSPIGRELELGMVEVFTVLNLPRSYSNGDSTGGRQSICVDLLPRMSPLGRPSYALIVKPRPKRDKMVTVEGTNDGNFADGRSDVSHFLHDMTAYSGLYRLEMYGETSECRLSQMQVTCACQPHLCVLH